MVTILGLRLPSGYVAERHVGHITVSLHGKSVGDVPHDIAPQELEARVNRHWFAGRSGLLPEAGTPSAGARFANRYAERDRDEANRERTTPPGLEWLVSHVGDDSTNGTEVHLVCDATGAWICSSTAELWTRFGPSA